MWASRSPPGTARAGHEERRPESGFLIDRLQLGVHHERPLDPLVIEEIGDVTDPVYLCPCHNSSFSKDGEKMDLAGRNNPSPRGLDKLKVNQEKLASNGEVWVEYVNYYTGRKEMKPKA